MFLPAIQRTAYFDSTWAVLYISTVAFTIMLIKMRLCLSKLNVAPRYSSLILFLIRIIPTYMLSEICLSSTMRLIVIHTSLFLPLYIFPGNALVAMYVAIGIPNNPAYLKFRESVLFFNFRTIFLSVVMLFSLLPSFHTFVLFYLIFTCIYLVAFALKVPAQTNSFAPELHHCIKLFIMSFFTQSLTSNVFLLYSSSKSEKDPMLGPRIVKITANDDLVYDSLDWKKILGGVPAFISVFVKFEELPLDENLGYKSRSQIISDLISHMRSSQDQLKKALRSINIPSSYIHSFWVTNTLILNAVPFTDELMEVLAYYRSNSTWIMYEAFIKNPHSENMADGNSAESDSATFYKYHIHLYATDKGKKAPHAVKMYAVDETYNLVDSSADPALTQQLDPENGFNNLSRYFDASVYEVHKSYTKGRGTVVGIMSFCPFSMEGLSIYNPPRTPPSDFQRLHDTGILGRRSSYNADFKDVFGSSIAPEAKVIGTSRYGSFKSSSFSITDLLDLFTDAEFLIAPNGDISMGADVVLLTSYTTISDPESPFRDSLLELGCWKQVVDVWNVLGMIPVIAAGSVTPESDYVDILRSLWNVIVVGCVSGITGNPSSFSASGMSSYNWNGRIIPDVVGIGEDINLSSTTALDAIEGGHFKELYGQGTSYAASSVAFTIALMLSVNPGLTRESALELLKETSIRPSHCKNMLGSYNTFETHYLLDVIPFRDPNASLSYPNTLYGYGIIQPLLAVQKASASQLSAPRRLLEKATSFLEGIMSNPNSASFPGFIFISASTSFLTVVFLL